MLGRIRAGAFAILAAFALAHPAQTQAARLPSLVDQNGHAFTFADLRGTPLVVTFVSAHCTDACPLIDGQFAQAAQQLRTKHVHARLLTITLDPEHDSIRDMRDLARRFGADPKTWIVAGGKRSDVHAVMSAFGVVAQRGRKGYAEIHTTFVYLIDARGRLRKTILASTVLTSQIVAMVR
ncbi:MAG TPA: SCO family protein [Candidatus Baltobacteraceae bacterium]